MFLMISTRLARGVAPKYVHLDMQPALCVGKEPSGLEECLQQGNFQMQTNASEQGRDVTI